MVQMVVIFRIIMATHLEETGPGTNLVRHTAEDKMEDSNGQLK